MKGKTTKKEDKNKKEEKKVIEEEQKKEEQPKTEEKQIEIKPRVEEQKNDNSIVTIILLVFIILGLVTYIAYDQGFILKKKTKNNNEQTETTNKEEQKEKTEETKYLEVTDPEIVNLYYTLTTSNTEYCGKGRVSDFFTDKKVTSKDISYETSSSIALNYLFINGILPTEKTTFTKKEMNEAITKIFGKNYKYENKEIDTCLKVDYDSKKETYTIGKSNCNKKCPTDYNRRKIVKALKKDNKIEIYVRAIFKGEEDSSKETKHSEDYYNYYKDYSKKTLIEVEREYDNSVIESEITFQKGSLYKITFTKEDNNYIFQSSELVNE